jgi:ABC-2 type transport system permease protein
VTVTAHSAPASAEAAVRPPSQWRSLKAVVRRGLRDHRRAWLTWGGSLGALSSLMAAIWPSIEGALDDALENYPEGLKDAFNIREITTVEQYIDAEMMSLIVPLAVSFLAIRIVTRAISSAEEQRYLDTLLAAPVARTTLVSGTLVVAGIVVATVLAVMTLMTWITSLVAGSDASLEVLGRGAANVWPLAMFFAGLATLAAGVLHRSSQVTGVAAGTLVAMYVIDVVGKLADPVAPLRYLSAFRYYGSAIQDGIDSGSVAVLTITGIVLAVAGALLFQRRDILA